MNPAVSSGIIIYLCHKPEKQWGYEDEAIGANAFLTAEEVDWLAEHGAIRMGYQDNYLAFCAQDKSTGELTGVRTRSCIRTSVPEKGRRTDPCRHRKKHLPDSSEDSGRCFF